MKKPNRMVAMANSRRIMKIKSPSEFSNIANACRKNENIL